MNHPEPILFQVTSHIEQKRQENAEALLHAVRAHEQKQHEGEKELKNPVRSTHVSWLFKDNTLKTSNRIKLFKQPESVSK